MPYTIELKNEHGYVRLTFLGVVTRGVLERSLEETSYALITNGWYKVFIDVTLGEITISPTELYIFMRMFRSKFLMDASIAILVRPDQMEVVCFIENAPYNRMDLKGCTDQDTAHKWLVRHAERFWQSIRTR
jgi:hypothetical protein